MQLSVDWHNITTNGLHKANVMYMVLFIVNYSGLLFKITTPKCYIWMR